MLVSTVGEPFVALSYVWGPGLAPWKTVKGNLNRRSYGFNISELPKTLRDACAVTREVKLRHLWIDAICIIQDDDLDWAHEAMKMHSIYAHAYVTIAACASTSSHDGLFNKASYDQISDMDHFVTISNRVANGTLSKLHMWDYHRDGQWDQLMHSTWRSRGWTCQERILSPKIIYHSITQLFRQRLHCLRPEDNFGPFGNVSDHLFDMRGNWRELLFGIDQRRRQQRSGDGEQLRIDNDKDEQIDLHDFGSAWTRGVVDG